MFIGFISPITATASTESETITVEVKIKNTLSAEFQSEVEAFSSGTIDVKAVITNVNDTPTQVFVFGNTISALSFISGSVKVDGINKDDSLFSLHGLYIGDLLPYEIVNVTFSIDIDVGNINIGRNSIPIGVSARSAEYNLDGVLIFTSGFINDNATLNITLPVVIENNIDWKSIILGFLSSGALIAFITPVIDWLYGDCLRARAKRRISKKYIKTPKTKNTISATANATKSTTTDIKNNIITEEQK